MTLTLDAAGFFGGAVRAPEDEGGAAEATPAAETSTPATAASAASAADDSDFDIPADIDDVVVIPKAPEPLPAKSGAAAETQHPAETVVAAPPPGTQPPPSQTTVQPPAQPPQAAQPAGPQTPPQPPASAEPPKPQALDPSTPEGFTQGLAQHKEALIQHLAKERFSLTSQDAEEVTTDPATAIPKLMARVFIEAMGTIQRQIQTFVPPIIQRQQVQQKQAWDAEQKFYAAFPQLPRSADADKVVDQIALAYRKAFPDASLEETIADVGALAMQKLKIAPAAVAPKKGNGAAKPPAPPAFQPAVGGVSAGAVAPEDDPWAGFTLPG